MKVDPNVELKASQMKALGNDVLKEQISTLKDGYKIKEDQVFISEIEYARNDLNLRPSPNNVLVTKTS